MRKTIQNGNQAVVITSNEPEGPFYAFVVVNVRNGVEHGDVTGVRASRNTLAGVERWASKQLAR